MRVLLLLCAAGAVLYGADPEQLVRRVAVYDFGSDPSAVRELETLTLGAAAGKDAPGIEKLLLAGLGLARTLAAKDAFCRDLAIIGGDRAVPTLAAMLARPETAEMARYALDRIPGTRSAEAMRAALARTSPAVQAGIVASLGRRMDAQSVDAIEPLLISSEPALAAAAAAALGRIATARARDALLDARPSPAVSDALLALAEQSSHAMASDIYRRLESDGHTESVRVAALQGLALVDATRAAPLLHAALTGNSARLQGLAIRELVRVEGVALAEELPVVPERARVQIISALAASGQPGVRPVLVDNATSSSEAVRVASLNGLARLGTATEIPMLAARAGSASGDERAAARAALASIPGDEADAAILRAMGGAEAKIKVELIRAVGERGAVSAAAALLTAASDPDRPVRIESIRALREVAGWQQAPALLALLIKAPAADRRELERTVASAIRRSKEGGVNDVIEAYQTATAVETRISLLNVLSAAGNSAGLPVFHQALDDSDADLQRAAISGLAGWPTPEPLDELLAFSRQARNPAWQILALRGYIKLSELPSNRTPAETANLLKAAMAAATRPDEMKAVLALAQRVVCPESLELARSVVGDSQVAAEARLAVTTLERQLSFAGK